MAACTCERRGRCASGGRHLPGPLGHAGCCAGPPWVATSDDYGCESVMRGSLTARSEHSSSQVSQQAAPPAAAHAIYLCDPRTEEECLSRSLLGLPASQAQVVRGIVPELSLLFLFNVRSLACPVPAIA